jgi:hypothetical protein
MNDQMHRSRRKTRKEKKVERGREQESKEKSNKSIGMGPYLFLLREIMFSNALELF